MTAAELEPVQFEAAAEGPLLRGESSGSGRGIFLSHGLSATRRYVVHGSKVLPRRGYRLHTYDARGHGESDPAAEYTYDLLADDLEAVIAERGGDDGLILGGHSMGCHTSVTFALRHPERVAALILIGPVYTGGEDDLDLGRWDERADALEREGPAGFARVVGEHVDASEDIRRTIMRLAQGRAELHRHPEAVAEALRQIPRSRPFGSLGELAALRMPVLVVGSHDEMDDGHPYAVAERYAEALPNAKMISEEKGQSPLSWQGGRLSREIAGFLESNGLEAAAG
ncbi:MAG TPA: alpha/beta fold hydrolase [Solirubrobacterales bacterium]|nr:alpha/beta fold hydrolase [Solirubrobacterales bacterium]